MENHKINLVLKTLRGAKQNPLVSLYLENKKGKLMKFINNYWKRNPLYFDKWYSKRGLGRGNGGEHE